MDNNDTNSKGEQIREKILNALINNPTKSIREIARDLGVYRQKVWRIKKEFEEKKVVWGYTSVVDEKKLNYVLYLLLLKMKPMSKELVDIIINRVIKEGFFKYRVRLINILYVNGEYDWIIMFSAKDHTTARRYYDSLRTAYENYLLEKPVIVDVNFALIREGKINPSIKELYNFIPY